MIFCACARAHGGWRPALAAAAGYLDRRVREVRMRAATALAGAGPEPQAPLNNRW